MIFEDASLRRWRITRRLFWGGVFLAGWVGALYVYTIRRPPSLPQMPFETAIQRNAFAVPLPMVTSSHVTRVVRPSPEIPVPSRILQLIQRLPSSTQTIRSLARDGVLTGGYLIQDDPDSVYAFRRSGKEMDVVFPDWYFISSNTCTVEKRVNEDTRQLLYQNPVAIMPRFTNGDRGKWSIKEVQQILQKPSQRTCLVQSLSSIVRQTDSKGINIDIEGLEAKDRNAYLEFLIELARALRQQNQLLTVAIPLTASLTDQEAIGRIADAVVLMGYDEHVPDGAPGPIASQTWVASGVENSLRVIPAEKLILGIASYAYDWNTDNRRAQTFSLKYQDVMQLARRVNAQPEMDSYTRNFRFAYKDANNERHEVWFLDGDTAWNHARIASEHRLLGTSLWRLGSEDPRVWNAFSPATTTLVERASLPSLEQATFFRKSEFFRVIQPSQTGELTRELDRDGSVIDARYARPPTGYVMEGIPHQTISPKQIVLTFNDHLDSSWSRQMLDMLDRYQVKAVFFATGKNVREQPELVREIVRRGHVIGNYTYTQTHISTLSDVNLRQELNRTQQVLGASAGIKTALFRPPYYYPDIASGHLEEFNALPTVSDMGYLVIGAGIDSKDWIQPTLQETTRDVERQLQRGDRHVIMVNETKDQKRSTQEALAFLIPNLQSKGYQFIGINEVLRSPVQTLNPTLSRRERLLGQVVAFVEFLRRWQWPLIYWMFMLTNILSITRILFLAVLAIQAKHSPKPISRALRDASVSVLIPAYNEEKTIAKTLRSLQQSTHRNMEVLVVNDGSTDQTAEVVESFMREDMRIRLLEKANGGKFSALNVGLREARNEIVVTIDADTILYPETINELIKPFEDPKVDAVCGNVEVGNVHNLLTGFQALEYITSQNFDRRAFERLNCIGVVPGATGAWRRKRVLDIGGYEADTLVEDADVTLRMLKHGGKIVYSPRARSRTEAPETIRSLAKQRLRWSFGTYQCLRKHYPYFFHGTLGWITLPNIFLFQIVYPVLSPIGDLVFLWALLTGQVRSILLGYSLFVAMDFVGSMLAFSLDRRPKKLMLLILVQRFFYRQFMYVVAFRSIIAMLRGARQGWNKLKRQGSVQYAPAVVEKHAPSVP